MSSTVNCHIYASVSRMDLQSNSAWEVSRWVDACEYICMSGIRSILVHIVFIYTSQFAHKKWICGMELHGTALYLVECHFKVVELAIQASA